MSLNADGTKTEHCVDCGVYRRCAPEWDDSGGFDWLCAECKAKRPAAAQDEEPMDS